MEVEVDADVVLAKFPPPLLLHLEEKSQRVMLFHGDVGAVGSLISLQLY